MSIQRTTAFAALLAAPLFACAAAVPPSQLVDARAEYQRATTTQGADLVQADLHTAHVALEQAESAFNGNGDTPQTRTLAYVADRKALTVESEARAAAAAKERDDAKAQYVAAQGQIIQQQRGTIAAESSALAGTSAALNEERKRRLEAEKRTKDALDRLAAFAAVKNDTRGVVITLSGAVLFETNKTDLRSTALEKLNQVVDAIKDDDRQFTINGYTDSQGALAYNEQLSQRRADAVRQYMISRGIDASRIKAVGMGPSNPVADNNSPEGRADNRRVEIILPPADTSK